MMSGGIDEKYRKISKWSIAKDHSIQRKSLKTE